MNSLPNDKRLKLSPLRPGGCFPSWDLIKFIYLFVGRDSVVGIATRYGLDGPGIEARWGAKYSAPSQTGPGAYPASYTVGTLLFPGGKSAGAWRWTPTPSSAEVKERVELYLYSPSGPSWPLLEWTLALPLFIYPWRSKQNVFSKVFVFCMENWRYTKSKRVMGPKRVVVPFYAACQSKHSFFTFCIRVVQQYKCPWPCSFLGFRFVWSGSLHALKRFPNLYSYSYVYVLRYAYGTKRFDVLTAVFL